MRARGERLVLTNGCFDLIHAGHVRYLRQALALGDALAVGVNGDASARLLKGPGRPINSANDRAEVLAALEAVSWVVIFDEDTAEELVASVQPAVYVKGGDYSDDPESQSYPVEGAVAVQHGGIVRIIEYVEDHSTSGMIDRIRNLECTPKDPAGPM